MSQIDKYIRTETIFSIIGSSVINILFFFLVFGASGPVTVWGMGNYVFDFVPQSFFTALICVLLPGLITRSRLSKGLFAPLHNPHISNIALVGRGLGYGFFALLTGGGAVATALHLWAVSHINWWPAFIAKILYGAVVAAITTTVGLRALLRAASHPA